VDEEEELDDGEVSDGVDWSSAPLLESEYADTGVNPKPKRGGERGVSIGGKEYDLGTGVRESDELMPGVLGGVLFTSEPGAIKLSSKYPRR
jgi:hypothetical protein